MCLAEAILITCTMYLVSSLPTACVVSLVRELFILCLPVSSALANSLDPYQARLIGSKLFDILMVFLKEFFKKVNFEKNQQTTK